MSGLAGLSAGEDGWGQARRAAVSWVLALLLGMGWAQGQTLARRGWAGSGISVERWWEGAVLYEVDPLRFSGGLGGMVERLDYVQSLGVEALVISPLPLTAGQTSGQPFDSRYGSEEDLAQVVAEASRRRMRVLVDLPLDGSLTGEETNDAARFWLSRGVAGLRLRQASGSRLTVAQEAGRVEELEKICAGYAGGRVLLWDLPWRSGYGERAGRKRMGMAAQMVVDRRLQGLSGALTGKGLLGVLRPGVGLAGATPMPVSDASGVRRSFDRLGGEEHKVERAEVLAALLLANVGTPLLYFGQEIGMTGTGAMAWEGELETANVAGEDADPGSLLNWYRRLSALRHGSAALRSGSMEVLRGTGTEVVAWLRRRSTGAALGAPVMVLCNLSGQAVEVSLTAEMRRLGVPTGRLRTLAATEATGGLESVRIGAIAVPAYGVYVGELRTSAGLETMPAPGRRRSGRNALRASSSGP